MADIRNRIEAIRRAPDYQKEFAQWRRLVERVKARKRTIDTDRAALSAHEQAMSKRWKVRAPFPPLQNTPLKDWNRLRFLNPLTEQAVEVLSPFALSKQGLLGHVVEGYDPIRLETDYESFRRKRDYGKVRVRGGKHLCLIVDVTRTKTELLEEITGYLKDYQRMLPEDKSRNKPTAAADIWDVYDQIKNDTPLEEIALRYTRDSRKANLNNPQKAALQAVKRAYEKAERLIREVK